MTEVDMSGVRVMLRGGPMDGLELVVPRLAQGIVVQGVLYEPPQDELEPPVWFAPREAGAASAGWVQRAVDDVLSEVRGARRWAWTSGDLRKGADHREALSAKARAAAD